LAVGNSEGKIEENGDFTNKKYRKNIEKIYFNDFIGIAKTLI
jgi:hypothetical protein